MPNGLKVRDHDWRSASSRDSAGPWNPRGKTSSKLKSARVRPAWADSLATAQSLIFRLLNRLVAGSRGAAHIAGIELLPEVRRDKAAVGVHTPIRVVGRRVRLAPHQELLWDRLVCPVPSVDVVLVVPRHLPRVFDVAVAAIACDLRVEPPGAVLLVVAGWRLLGILHPGRPPLQHGLAPLMQGDRHPRLFNFHEVGRELSSSGRAGGQEQNLGSEPVS